MIERVSRLFESKAGALIYDKAIQAIKDHSMGEKLVNGVLVGFSGGPDSVMLLCVLKKYAEENSLGKICAVHVNHMIRGEEADRDEEFSQAFCKALDIEFVSLKRDVPAEAKACSGGIEEIARNIRYSIFSEILCGRNDISCIAVAHNSTDNLETVIMNMMRGSGTRGLAGIPPVRDNIIRPLLYSSKKQILNALSSSDIPFVIDSTNSEIEYKRNYIRNELLPKFERLSDDPEGIALRFCKNLRLDSDYIDSEARTFLESANSNVIHASSLRNLHPALFSRVIALMAINGGSTGIEAVHISKISDLIKTSSNFVVCLPGEVRFVCRYNICTVEPEPCVSAEFDHVLSMGENYIEEIDSYIILSESSDIFCSSNVYKISIKTSIDFDIINGDVRVRNKIDGDSYVYGGMTRKLKKLFNDRNISKELRSKIPVFYDNEGILWVKGFPVRDGGAKDPTKKLFISILEKQA